MEIIIVLMLLAVLYLLLSDRGLLPSSSRAGATNFKKRKIILDSCALIDGRIVELVRTGFVADELVIPKFILRELQMLADGNDSHKRERARFGLEVAAELQEYSWVTVSINDTNFPDVKVVDDKLVMLAQKLRAVLCTTDYNLNKVASVEDVKVANINELVQGLRAVALPGEQQTVKILQRGSNQDQGVGYLEDGTMVVVDGAAKFIGKPVDVAVDRMHQTVAGKMVFAHIVNNNNLGPKKSNRPADSSASSANQAKSKVTSRRPDANPKSAKSQASPGSRPNRTNPLAGRMRTKSQALKPHRRSL